MGECSGRGDLRWGTRSMGGRSLSRERRDSGLFPYAKVSRLSSIFRKILRRKTCPSSSPEQRNSYHDEQAPHETAIEVFSTVAVISEAVRGLTFIKKIPRRTRDDQ